MKLYTCKLILASIALMTASLGLSRVFSWVHPKEWTLLIGAMCANSFLAVYPLNKFSSKDPATVYLWGSLFRLFPLAVLLAWTAQSFSQSAAHYLISAILIYISFLFLEVRQLQKNTFSTKATS